MRRSDYSTGREAIGVLLGRRGSVRRAPRAAVSTWVVLAASAGVAVIAGIVSATGINETAQRPLGLVETPPAAIVEDPVATASMVMAVDRHYADWAEAAAALEWARQPGWIPSGMRLEALQGFSPPTEPNAVDSLIATYLAGSGERLELDQFYIARPEAFDIKLTLPGNLPPDIGRGEVVIERVTAWWAEAVGTMEPDGTAGLDRGATVLTWSEGSIGYRLTGYAIDVATLTKVAESLIGDT